MRSPFDDLIDEMSTVVSRQNAALLCWHRLYGWPALRYLERQWPTLRAVP